MSNFTEIGIVRKIIVVLTALIVFNFIYPNYVRADRDQTADPGQAQQEQQVDGARSEEEKEEGWVATLGILGEPIISFSTAVGDSIIELIQDNMLGLGTSYITVNRTSAGVFMLQAIGIGAAALIGFIAAPGGIALGIGGAIAGGLAAWGTTKIGEQIGDKYFDEEVIPNDFKVPIYKVTPEAIFSNAIPLLDVNFINPNPYKNVTVVEDGQTKQADLSEESSAYILQETVAKWYVALRNLALVILLSILIYVGIRMVMSSTAKDKSKYKIMIKDWGVAIVILLCMHFIMAIALTGTQALSKMFISMNEQYIVYLPKSIFGEVEDTGLQAALEESSSEDGKHIAYPVDFMGAARIYQQLDGENSDGKRFNTHTHVGYTMIFVVMVLYTVMFLLKYIKRVIYLAFLTIIAPLVAVTYPIDKISDGKAQAFDMWLKEYIYNLLLQPFHLILYTVLIGTSMQLAQDYMIYAIVALGFLLQAESLLRKFFGFEKAGTVGGGVMSGAAVGAMAMKAIQGVANLAGKAGGKVPTGGGDTSTANLENRGADSGATLESLLGVGGNGNAEDTTVSGEGSGSAAFANPPNPEDIKNNFKDNQAEQTFLDTALGGGPAVSQGATNPSFKEDIKKSLAQQYGQNTNTNNSTLARKKKKRIKLPTLPSRVTGGARIAKDIAASAAKTGVKVYTAGTGAFLAGAAALASDSYSNIPGYIAGGLGAGYGIGKAATNPSTNYATIKKKAFDIRDRWQQETLSDSEYKKKKQKQLDNQFEKDRERIKFYKDQLGVNFNDDTMANAVKYRQYGVTDDKIIAKAMKLDGLGGGVANKDRIAVAKIAQGVEKDKDVEDAGKRLQSSGVAQDKIDLIKLKVRELRNE